METMLIGQLNDIQSGLRTSLFFNHFRFYAYKLPDAYPPWPAYGQGVQFLYMKPGSTDFTLSKASVDLANSSIGYTMIQAYTDAVGFLPLLIFT